MNEIRNFKGEVVGDDVQSRGWWRLSPSTGLLIIGLVLLNVGCFVDAGLIDRAFRAFDVRLWPWWYFVCLAILVIFSIRWGLIRRDFDDYDEFEQEEAKRFVRLSVFLTVLVGLILILHGFNLLWRFTEPLKHWFGYGTFSKMGAVSFGLVIAILIPLIYFVKEWFVTFRRPD